MTAIGLTRILLEDNEPDSPYDLDGSLLDQPEYPAGLVATWPDSAERIEWRLETGRQGRSEYRMSKFWIDDASGQPREARNIGSVPASRYHANAWLQRETARLERHGWTVKPL